MTPKRKIDEDVQDTKSKVGPSSKRNKTKHPQESLDQETGEESSVLSTKKILFKGHSEGSSIGICIFS